MLSNIRKVSKGPLGYGLRLLVLALGLVLIVAACGGPEALTPSLGTPGTESIATGPTSPAAPDAESVAPTPTTPAIPDAESVALAPTAPATPESESVAHETTVPATTDVEGVTPTPIPTPTAATPTESIAPAPIQSARPEGESVTPEPTAPPTPDTERIAPAPTAPATPAEESVTPEATPTYSIHPPMNHGPPAHYGAATAPLEKRIYLSDVIVRASLESTKPGLLRFRAIEYLKGTGETQFAVHAYTSNRNTAWDDREAVLFLSLQETGASGGAAGASGEASSTNFQFTDTDKYYRGDYPEGHTIDTSNPVWLPAEAGGGASGAEGGGAPASDPAFITDAEAVTEGSSTAISLADLRSMIAWVEGGEGIEGYDRCIRSVLDYKRWDRDWEAYYGRPWTPYQSEAQVASGAAEGTVVDDYGSVYEPGYHRFWLTGTDADLFQAQIVDDDEVASNGYTPTLATARPLPGGVYRFLTHFHAYVYTPCNFTPENSRLEWIVTAVAPDSAAHEAFFDPVAIGGAVGADAANGVLKPASFSLTDGGSTASLSKIAWEAGRATVELDPSLSLAGHHADFIALDGSVSLRLDFDDATETVAGTKRTLAWNVCTQPWESGDLLMLRISSSGENLTGVTNDGPCN